MNRTVEGWLLLQAGKIIWKKKAGCKSRQIIRILNELLFDDLTGINGFVGKYFHHIDS